MKPQKDHSVTSATDPLSDKKGEKVYFSCVCDYPKFAPIWSLPASLIKDYFILITFVADNPYYLIITFFLF